MDLETEKEGNILVIDDDKQLADMLVKYLSKLGYRTFSENNGFDGIARFKTGYFQLILLDLKMPDINGIEVLDRIKGIDRQAVVIIITGEGTIESAVSAIKKGAYDYITKPFDLKSLEVVINRAMERRTLVKQVGIFRGVAIALLISIPLWLLLGIFLASLLK
ncbi:MAG: response regulator [Spirochaetota bacterium]|nr:response regulator [Spirochaetota bacterium]